MVKIQTIPIKTFSPKKTVKSRYSTTVITGTNITGKTGTPGYIYAPYIPIETVGHTMFDDYLNRLIQTRRESKLKVLLDSE